MGKLARTILRGRKLPSAKILIKKHKYTVKIDWNKLFERVKVFLVNIPGTIKETFTWLAISYLIPIINIGIIWGIKQHDFNYSVDILSIVLVTNASFLTSLFLLAYANKNNRKLLKTISIIFYVLTLTLFVVSTIEIVISEKLFTLKLYKIGTLFTLFASLILGLISKYDEQVALSKARANKGKGKTSTNLGDKNIKL